MANVRDGNRAVLLVVDVQVGVMAGLWDAQRIIGNVALAVEKARAREIPIIWVRHHDEELVRDTPEWQLVPELVPAADEIVIEKQFNSSFEQTELEKILSDLDATHVVLTGAATNWCIRATAYGALDRGYDLTLVSDAHTTETITLTDGQMIPAADIVRELNIAMSWLSYPQRSNRVATAAELDFIHN